MTRTEWLFVLAAALLLAWPAAHASFYCGRYMVSAGDAIWRVGRVCPDPFWVERWQEPHFFDRGGFPLGFGSDTIEVWYLNFGDRRLMRRLIFRNGRLERETGLRYGVGHVPGTRRCTAHELAQAGDTIGEIYARCGEPDFRYDFSPFLAPYFGGPGPLPHGTDRQVWAYDYGAGRLVRELLFIDGRLIRTRAEQR